LPPSPRALFAALTVAVLSAFGTFSSSTPALADSALAALVAKPVSLPDMALGQPTAPITIVEYSSLTCPHCADFAENVFPMLQSKYIDTGKVRFVSREFPLEIKAAGASMLARCSAGGDSQKYFDATTMLFKQQQALLEHTTDTLKAVGGKFGMSEEAVEACVKGQCPPRQDQGRPGLRLRQAEGRRDADFLHQRRTHQRVDVLRGIREATGTAIEAVTAFIASSSR
jgi:protein-disulfide isomerase